MHFLHKNYFSILLLIRDFLIVWIFISKCFLNNRIYWKIEMGCIARISTVQSFRSMCYRKIWAELLFLAKTLINWLWVYACLPTVLQIKETKNCHFFRVPIKTDPKLAKQWFVRSKRADLNFKNITANSGYVVCS